MKLASLLLFLLPTYPSEKPPRKQTTDKTPLQKWFILAVGPPGSGKSSVVTRLSPLLQGVEGTKPHFIIVDDIVGQYKSFQKAVATNRVAIQGLVSEYTSVTNVPEEEWEHACKATTRAYYKVKHQADNKSENQITAALENNRPIISIELMLADHPGRPRPTTTWLAEDFIPMVQGYGYKIAVIYPFVSYQNLVQRTRLRAMEIGRLPCATQIKDNLEMSGRNLKLLMDMPSLKDDLFVFVNNDGEMGSDAHRLPMMMRSGGKVRRENGFCEKDRVKVVFGEYEKDNGILEVVEEACGMVTLCKASAVINGEERDKEIQLDDARVSRWCRDIDEEFKNGLDVGDVINRFVCECGRYSEQRQFWVKS